MSRSACVRRLTARGEERGWGATSGGPASRGSWSLWHWDTHGVVPGTYQYTLLPLDADSEPVTGCGTPGQLTIAG